ADSDETVRQAAAHSASVRVDRGAILALLQLLSGPSAQNRRVAAEALGRMGDPGVVPAILAQIEKPNDRVLDHSLTYALIEIADARSTGQGLKSSNPRVRRSAMIALDQMEGGGVDPKVVASELTSSDAPLRETAAWIAARHPDWGDALASVLRRQIASADLKDEDRGRLQHQLARLARSDAIRALLAQVAADSGAPLPSRRLALGAMAESGLKEAPPEWVEAIAAVLKDSDGSLLADAVAAAGRLPLNSQSAPSLGEQLVAMAGQEKLPPDVRLAALAAAPGPIGSLDQN